MNIHRFAKSIVSHFRWRLECSRFAVFFRRLRRRKQMVRIPLYY